MTLLIIATGLGGASWSLIFMVAAIILLFLAAFIQPSTGGPWYRSISFGWAGMLFFALAVALGGK